MGVAAYTRGTQAIKNQSDKAVNAEIRNCFEIIARLNTYPKGNKHYNGEGVIRIAKDGCCWIMNHKDTGWASYGMYYSTMKKLIFDWNIEITGHGSDQYSVYYTIKDL